MPTFTGVLFCKDVALFVNRPEPLEEILITKNKFYDKHVATIELV